MTPAETSKNFFRQSGWMMVANLLCGFCMMFVHPFAGGMPDYSLFMTILRIFVLVTLPAATLQTILAQQTAAAVTDKARRDVSATARGVLKATFIFWLILLLFAGIFRQQFMDVFHTTNPNLIWATMLLILAALWMPIFQGLLQGLQDFLLLGWSMIANGIGRVIAIAIGVIVFNVNATGATVAAFLGVMSAVVLAAWPARVAFRPNPGVFDWRAFLKKLAPLAIGAGSSLFLINVDMPLVQAYFPDDPDHLEPYYAFAESMGMMAPILPKWANYYAAAEAIGIALVTLCVPVAAVMFPKLVRSRATGASSNALYLAVLGTIVLAGSAAIFCTIFPKLPLQIMFFRTPDRVKAWVLIPWFMWAMIPVTMYNVLINSLIARAKYAIVPWAAGIPILYALTLNYFLAHNTLPAFDAFRRVIQILMAFSSALLAVSIWFSYRASREESAEIHSEPRAATP